MKGKARLAESGYYVGSLLYEDGTLGDSLEKLEGLNGIRPIYISPLGKCKYIQYDESNEWGTLMWTCAPTKKNADLNTPCKKGERCEQRYTRYDSIDEINKKYGKKFPKCELEK